MASLQKSTIVRFRNRLLRAGFRYAEHLAPGRAGRAACDLWFTAPPRMADAPVPEGGAPFEVEAQGHAVRGLVWGDGPRVDGLPHARLGRSRRAVRRDGARRSWRPATAWSCSTRPAHGDSDHGPAGPRRTNGVEFGKALDAVFCRFGPAEAVVAHSMGTISTYLALRYGWLGAERLVFIAPMVEAASLFDQFQAALGFGPRVRAAFDRAVDEFVGVAVAEFDARVQARHVEALPTLVITDRGDRQTPYADVVDFAETIDAPLVTTEGLGHRKILRDPAVVERVVEFVGARRCLPTVEPQAQRAKRTSRQPDSQEPRVTRSMADARKCSNPQAWPLWRGRTGGRSRFACGSGSCLRFASSVEGISAPSCCWGC